MKREIAERHGRRGEGWAALWLRLQGWRIVARRVKTPRGEIDLIARRGRTVAFIEVKARASRAEADLALDDYRLRRVAAGAEAVAHHYARNGDQMRIDAMFLIPRRLPRHVPDVWRG